MQEIINILKNYWPQLLAIFMFIASFILQCLKKKPVNSLFERIYELCIFAINVTEKFSNLKGSDKLDKAVSLVSNILVSKYPDLDIKNYRKYIVSVIENILSTPQKHENK